MVWAIAMKSSGPHRMAPAAKLVSLTIVIAAMILATYVWHQASLTPTTDDASIDADVVHVAAAVGGRILAIPVVEIGRAHV